MATKKVVKSCFFLAMLIFSRPSFGDFMVSNNVQSGDSGPIDSFLDGISIATFTLPAAPIGTITDFQIEFTLDDGDTAFGDADHGALTLYLNGLDTGVVLNGFADGSVDRLTFNSTVTPAFSSLLLSSIGPGGLVSATIHDTTSNPVDFSATFPNSNIATLPSDNFGQPVIAKLQIGFIAISAVPEPSSGLMLLGLGLSIAGAKYRRRSTRKVQGASHQCN
jgi:PEP-CTERM motif